MLECVKKKSTEADEECLSYEEGLRELSCSTWRIGGLRRPLHSAQLYRDRRKEGLVFSHMRCEETTSSCAREGIYWTLGRIYFGEGGQARMGCSGKWWNLHLWRYLRSV